MSIETVVPKLVANHRLLRIGLQYPHYVPNNRAVHPELRFFRPNTANMPIVPRSRSVLARRRPRRSPSHTSNRSSPTWRANVTWPTIPWPPTAAIRSGFSNGSGPARSAATLSVRDLADYVAWLHEQKLNPTSIARHIASLKVFFRYLQLEGVLVESQAELLGSQKLWERVPKVLSPAQVARMFEMPKPGDLCWRRDRALLGTALRHGLPGVGAVAS